MSCLMGDLADAVKADLATGQAAGQLSGTFTPARAWAGGVKLRLQSMGTTRYVYAVVGPLNDQPMDRAEDEERRYVHVVVLQRVDPSSNSEMDSCGQLWEEIYDRYATTAKKTVTVGSNTWQCLEHSPVSPEEAGLDEQILKDTRLFLGVVRTEWLNKGAA